MNEPTLDQEAARKLSNVLLEVEAAVVDLARVLNKFWKTVDEIRKDIDKTFGIPEDDG